MTDTIKSDLQRDVFNKITYIKNNFIEEGARGHPFFGGTASVDFSSSTNTSSVEAQFTDAIFNGYTSFCNLYKDDIVTPSDADLDTKVLFRDVRDASSTSRKSYSNITEIGSGLTFASMSLSNIDVYNTEINLSRLLTQGDNKLANNLDKVRTLYSLLEPSVYTRYRALVNTSKIPTDRTPLTLHKYTTDGTTTSFSVATEESFGQVKDLMSELFIGKILMTTKSFLPIGDATINTVAELTSNERNNQGVDTSDAVIRIKHNTSENAFKYTKVVTLPKPSHTSSVRITFRYKMETATNYLNNGTLRLVTNVGGSDKNHDVAVSNSWQSSSVVYEGITTTTNVTVKFGNSVAAPSGKTRSILITDVKAEYFEDETDALSDAPNLPLLKETDLFTARRLLRMYELMTNLLIACNLYEKSSTASAEKLVALCYSVFAAAKLNVSMDVEGVDSDTMPDLTKLLNERMKQVSTEGDRINQLDSITTNFKLTIRSESEKLAGRREQEKKAMTMMYMTLAVTCIVVLVSVGSYFSPMEKPRKLSLIGIAFSIALIFFVIINLVFNKQVEGFYNTAATELPSVFNQRQSLNTILSAIDSMATIGLAFADEYLDQTINTAYVLASYRTYGNLNQVMNRERNLYENRAIQMNNNIYKLNDANNVVHMKHNIQKARISFFISLTVVISITVVALLMLDSLPGASNVIIGVAGVVITIFAIAFFVDTSGRVNTSGQKYYWGQPDVRNLN